MDIGRSEWFLMPATREAFVGSRGFPTMGDKETFDVGVAMDFDIGAGLFKVRVMPRFSKGGSDSPGNWRCLWMLL
jgi:hypothetical protein